MSAGDINVILNLWAASLAIHDDEPPFSTAARMYDTIDTIALSDVAWMLPGNHLVYSTME